MNHDKISLIIESGRPWTESRGRWRRRLPSIPTSADAVFGRVAAADGRGLFPAPGSSGQDRATSAAGTPTRPLLESVMGVEIG